MAERPFPDSALAQHTAILGKTGSGKTFTAKLAVEQAVADGARVCILDPIKSDWWGLTSSADGKRPGLPFYILGGPHGHVGLPSSSGRAIGELVASGALPLSIIDMADFEPGGLPRFFTEFAQALLRGMRGEVYLVIEEAHEFAPKERSGIGAENMAIHWAKKLALAGRSKGIRLILATQRTQSLHNALLNSCETMIVHRTIAPGDKATVVGWFKDNATKEQAAAVSRSLSSLRTGTAWLSSGEAGLFEQRQFPRITTYDNSATPTKDRARPEVKTAPVDQEKLRTIIGAAVQEAGASDPAKLRARIARLEAQILAAGKPSTTPTPEPAAARDARYIEELEGRLKAALVECERSQSESRLGRERFGALRDWLTSFAEGPDHLPGIAKENPGAPTGVPVPPVAAAPRKPVAAAPKPPATVPEGVSTPQARVLSSLEFWRSVGHDAPSREQVAAVAGYAPGSGNFGNIVGGLRTAGQIEIPRPGHLCLAPGVRFRTLTPTDAAEHLRGVLNAPQKKLVFAASYAAETTREKLAEASGYAAGSGNFGNLIGSLCTLGIFIKPRAGCVSLSDWARQVLTPGGND